ncbi:MAG TPA: hypothetical protein VFY66_17850 [Anaerolineales bacterium]|nr:hypothetical protein [Anaerolineales bacterium]
MKRRLIHHLILLSALLAACAPATASPEPAAQGTQPPSASQPTLAPSEPTLEAATQPAPVETTVPPVATSRGPDLHATDPTTVSLASGGLQFVEFFRFT